MAKRLAIIAGSNSFRSSAILARLALLASSGVEIVSAKQNSELGTPAPTAVHTLRDATCSAWGDNLQLSTPFPPRIGRAGKVCRW